MTRHEKLMGQLETYSLGFDKLFSDFNTTNYPPHNIYSVNDDKFIIEMAVAGFSKDEIKLQEHSGILTISAEKKTIDENKRYQHRGIAQRAFSKRFQLVEHLQIESAALDLGILTVVLVMNVPEEEKPKYIDIT